MCKYCKHLEEVRNLERKSYERVIAHLRKELRQDDELLLKLRERMDLSYDKLDSMSDFDPDTIFSVQCKLDHCIYLIDKCLGKEGD